jgi:hypothetical protein
MRLTASGVAAQCFRQFDLPRLQAQFLFRRELKRLVNSSAACKPNSVQGNGFPQPPQ